MTEHSPSSKLPRVTSIVKQAQDGRPIRIRKFDNIAPDLNGINRQQAKAGAVRRAGISPAP